MVTYQEAHDCVEENSNIIGMPVGDPPRNIDCCHLSLCVVVLPRGLPSTPTGRGHHERRGTLDARDSRQALDGQEGEWARLTLLLPCQSSFPSAAPRLMNSVALGSNA
jgi:hypothetical protein